MTDPAFELDSSECAALLSAVERARQAGYPVDPLADALLTVLRRQLASCEDGFEDEMDVADFEQDDPDEEADTSDYEPDTENYLGPLGGPLLPLYPKQDRVA